jgi:NAD(P)-dependent dehydrogenase (short-subunit alcohol dehydrogenase family)
MASQPLTVLITGCSTGIGRALAEAFHARGHVAYATARRLEALEDLKAKGLRTAALDVNDPASIRALVQRLETDGATVDVLVNNAGYGAMGPLAEFPLDDLRRQFETNVFAVLAMIQALLPGMTRRRAGRIVNIGSVSGVLVTPFSGAYCATKAAVHALSDALRLELAPFGIRVITVQPGGIQSQFGATASQGVVQRSGRNSLYAPVADAIAERANASQQDATPAGDFAREMVDAVLVENPPAVIRIGHGSFLLPFLSRWLPPARLDRILSRRFKLDRLRQA